ncbi:hypothetical protein [Okeania sp. KiyG1]|uniref:hypothetical protein n=1 Tax=Okeania sp. KiyG1 TaxID=2720165 RepID=UPI001923A2F4|nr:hypothetical protein [Okeania sp. KiyG1]
MKLNRREQRLEGNFRDSQENQQEHFYTPREQGTVVRPRVGDRRIGMFESAIKFFCQESYHVRLNNYK